MHKYQNIKNNNCIYYNFVNYYSVDMFQNIMLSTLISKEDSTIQNNIDYIKRLRKDYPLIDLRSSKHFFDMLCEIGFIEYVPRTIFKIKDSINELNSLKELIWIIENGLSVEQFLRRSKIKKIKNKLNGI